MSTEPCQNFCCSAFIQYLDAPLTKTDILETEIHPLFAPKHFDKAIDYSLIELPLRLVSQWLKLDPVVRLIVVMAEGELKRDGAWKGSKPFPVDFKTLDGFAMRGVWPNVGRYATPEQDTVGPEMRQRAAELLLGVVGLIRFRIDEISGHEGKCIPSERPLVHPNFPRGSKSIVFVGKDNYRLIESFTPASERVNGVKQANDVPDRNQ
ncbi:Hypothetical predicted protein [Lecanosticta acicola]|uniref:Uncharacterized protein n=1 Tax=Lecanosticta acicola TaxID=111012 RepID=A0AAI8Z222_9PEZI|nr:Hypothetical predicted protein [Lecanosticta acicola]